jgi:hypothetical protein
MLNDSLQKYFAMFRFRVTKRDMAGGNSVVGLWRDREREAERIVDPNEALIENEPQFAPQEWDEDMPVPGLWRRRLSLAAILTLSALWLGALGYQRFSGLEGRLPLLGESLDFVAMASAPLALVAALWLIAARSGRGEERRFQRTSNAIQREAARLESLLGLVAERMDASRAALAEQGEILLGMGDNAASRLSGIARAMESEIETVSRHTQALTGSAAAARGDLAVLLANLPKADVQTRQMVASLQEAGLVAHERAGALDAQLSLLTARGREADEIAGNAAQKLAAHLSRMEGVSEVAGARLEQAAEQMTGAVDDALERASLALESARQGMEAQGAAMMALVEQSQAALAQTGADSTEQLARRVAAIGDQIEAVSQSFAAQDQIGHGLMTRLHTDLDSVEQRFALLESGGLTRTERLGTAIKALSNHTDDLKTALAGGGDTANALVERVQSLMTAIDAATREIDETVPQAYARLEARARESMEAVSAATPVVMQLSEAATTALERLAETDAMLTRQQDAMASLSSMSETQLADSRKTADELAASIALATADAERLVQGAAPQLVEALLRVRETASQASEHARTALAEVIPQSAEALGAMSKDALARALTAQVEAQMAEIASTTEKAVGAAQKATDRLMRQMLTISETSAALEARISEAREQVEQGDQANFARRVALLIESLNSTAIDVNKILSNEVTDTAWASYLRGDRGIFTRRAVKLLNSGEVREIARHYENEPEFREQVNRYVHDFEAMLRNILATRDGTPLSVTLLSSDTGKLYVALAQAIERLRT